VVCHIEPIEDTQGKRTKKILDTENKKADSPQNGRMNKKQTNKFSDV
jgi:hypothetical protein